MTPHNERRFYFLLFFLVWALANCSCLDLHAPPTSPTAKRYRLFKGIQAPTNWSYTSETDNREFFFFFLRREQAGGEKRSGICDDAARRRVDTNCSHLWPKQRASVAVGSVRARRRIYCPRFQRWASRRHVAPFHLRNPLRAPLTISLSLQG